MSPPLDHFMLSNEGEFNHKKLLKLNYNGFNNSFLQYCIGNKMCLEVS